MIPSRIPNSCRTRRAARLSSYTLALCCLAGPEVLSAHEANHTHPSLAAASLELLNTPDFYGPDEVREVLAGTINEDDCSEHFSLFHFFNPRTGRSFVAGSYQVTAKQRADALGGKHPGTLGAHVEHIPGSGSCPAPPAGHDVSGPRP